MGSVAECYRVLQSVTEYNRVLQNITEYYRVLQSISSASTWTNFWACFLWLRTLGQVYIIRSKFVLKFLGLVFSKFCLSFLISKDTVARQSKSGANEKLSDIRSR